MGISAQPGFELAHAAQAGECSLEEMLARVPVELELAEDAPGSVGGELDGIEQDFLTDPCRFLRVACQAADYGEEGAPSRVCDGARGVSRQ